MITRRKLYTLAALVLACLLLVPLSAQATAYTWTGNTSTDWATTGNWSVSGFPNAYTDTASIPYVTAHPAAVTLSNTALLGGGGTALALGAKSTTGNANGLDITSTGLLGIQGSISIGTRRTMTIEGTLRNDSNLIVNPTGTAYNISGGAGITLNGATLSNIAGGNGSWNITSPLTISGGTNTFSTPIRTNLTMNGGTLNLNNSLTGTANYAAFVLNNAGTVMNINSGGSLILDATSANPELVVNTGTTVNLNGGTISGINATTFSPDFGGAGNINVTANSTLAGKINNDTTNHPGLKPINIGNVGGTIGDLGAHTLNLAAYTGNLQFKVGTGGVLNNSSSSGTTSAGGISLLGGSITNLGGGTFNLSGGLTGYGNVSGFTGAVGTVTASGGTLAFNAGTGIALGSHSGTGTGLGSSASSTLELKGLFNYINAANITPNGGTVALNGATLNTNDPTGNLGNPYTWNVTLYPGTINVTDNSTLIGKFTSSADLTIQNGKTLTASAPTYDAGTPPTSFTNNGTVYNNGGTAIWGNFVNNGTYKSDPSTQTFTNLTVGSGGSIQASAGDVYNILGNFINNSTQNTTWETTAAALNFITGGTSSHNVALAGADLGQNVSGYVQNFAWKILAIATGQSLNLSDGNATSGAALYVRTISGETIVGNNVTNITGNGFNIYYDASLNPDLHGMTFNLKGGGYLEPSSPVPLPPSVLLLGSGLLGMGLLGFRRRRMMA